MSQKKYLIVIAGPTAVGKTKVAIELAKQYKTEIISADSRQFYKDLKIGTAAPTPSELAQAKHHLVGNLNLDDYYNVSIFEQQALKILETIFQNNQFAIAVGGSGLYVNALCSGIDDLPDADPELRNKLNNQFINNGLEWLQKEVEKLDPDYFEIVDKKNPKRLLRALEVINATNKTYTEQRLAIKRPRPFEIIKIALNQSREILFQRISDRVDQMIQDGLIEEVEKLKNYQHLNSLNTVGYKEIFQFLDNKINKDQAIEDIKTNTRRYAKRQITWFKKDTDFQWFKPNEVEEIISYINSIAQ